MAGQPSSRGRAYRRAHRRRSRPCRRAAAPSGGNIVHSDIPGLVEDGHRMAVRKKITGGDVRRSGRQGAARAPGPLRRNGWGPPSSLRPSPRSRFLPLPPSDRRRLRLRNRRPLGRRRFPMSHLGLLRADRSSGPVRRWQRPRPIFWALRVLRSFSDGMPSSSWQATRDQITGVATEPPPTILPSRFTLVSKIQSFAAPAAIQARIASMAEGESGWSGGM